MTRPPLRRYAIWLLLVALSAAFGAEPIDARVALGFGSAQALPAAGRLVPVQVTLNNPVADASGVIRLRQGELGAREVTHILPFTSPANSVKRYTMLVRLQEYGGIHLEIDFDGKQKSLVVEPKIQVSTEPLVLCVLPDPSAVRALRAGAEEAYRFVQVTLADLPDTPIVYDGIHALVLTGNAFSSLSANQLSALRDWLLGGGRVAILDPAFDAAFAEQYRRIALPTVQMHRTGVYPYGGGYLASGGSDNGLNPFWMRGGKPIPDYAGGLFPALLKPNQGGEAIGYDSLLIQQIANRKGAYGLRGFLWLALIVGAYVLVIGPLDWWICRRTRKSWLTWPIFLSAILGFSFLAYWYSTLVHAGNMQTVQVNIVDAADGAAVARGESFVWIYSTRNQTYDIVADQPAVVYGANESPTGASAVTQVDIDHRQPAMIRARIPIFSSKTFTASWHGQLPGTIHAERQANDRFRLDLPEGLEVTIAYYADRQGLTRLSKQTDADGASLWRLGERTAWSALLSGTAMNLQTASNHFQIADEEGLPGTEALMAYVYWLSFADRALAADDESTVDGQNPGNDYDFGLMLSRTSRHERALSRADLLLDGRDMLILQLTEDTDLLPVRFTDSTVDSRRLDVIRLFLPPAPESPR